MTPPSPPLSRKRAQHRPPRNEPAQPRKAEEVFDLPVQVISDPLTGTPLVLPLPRKTWDTASGGEAG